MPVSIGNTVIYRQPRHEAPANGVAEHPAIVTRVWHEHCVNLTVFFDGAAPEPICSVQHAGLVDPGERCWYVTESQYWRGHGPAA